ncbi:glycoside hydrolase family 5 protein [Serpula lacrymans var. lacrymans S7.9]|uniref:mannan endo-1,4-beta-mannosidase n=1 Tax=Serpula lacrymans var. lacrymans (strain S7.9) TaxID=578457 RepID=F8NST9_SERL9|nr:glycoside hydrolase family 5 protein [Serpula lacrymans var. lacrymans S7.9]EGO25412.1 glycoside hydrolase family 5 protein [Serpula lacrymans var. lacrymans S7.9]
MKLSAGLITLALTAVAAAQSVSEWGQCGGINYTGSTTCASGLTCTEINTYYYQCLASVTTVTTSTSSTTSTAPPATTSSPSAPITGFVSTSGQKFTLNGATYTVVGGNAYWVGLMGLTTSEMNVAFKDIAATGATTVRTWGFNEVTSASGDYYQLWTNGVPTINTGATGLQNFDNVVAAAKANGLRLIVTLTNNWSDYGGMDVYVNQLVGQGQPHDYFYTNSACISAFQNYAKTFVTRYLNEPTILGWELANEPRCTGSTGTTSGSCTVATVTNWVKTMSAYIKSVDSNHLVGLGDEGWFNDPSSSDYPYQGGEGIDFVANLAIDTIDFGTFHLYPGSWGETSNSTSWGQEWIINHYTAQANANKPVIMEEFGVTSDQYNTYSAWYSTVQSSGLSGVLIWQAGSNLSSGQTPNDGYAIYPGTQVYTLETQYAASMKARG